MKYALLRNVTLARMKKTTKLHALGLLVGILLITGCEKNENFTDDPQLEWRSAEFVEDEDPNSARRSVDLTLYFTDGDGNVGSEEEEVQNTCDPNEYDLLINYFEKVDGEFVEETYDTVMVPVTDDDGNIIDSTMECLTYHVILPDLMPEGQNKTLEGEITTTFDFSNFPRNNTDSIRFEVRLFDRDRNRSNIVTSPAIAIPE